MINEKVTKFELGEEPKPRIFKKCRMNNKQKTEKPNKKPPKEKTVIVGKNLKKEIEKRLSRFIESEQKNYLIQLLEQIVLNKQMPIELIDHIPVFATEAKKTLFDQIYDAVISLAFPNYSKEVVEALFTSDEENQKLKIWKVIIPRKYKISHVMLRAETFQEAFGLACDYMCRISLRMYGKIPNDLSIRVISVPESTVKKKILKDIEVESHKNKNTIKKIYGARFAALGHPSHPNYRISWYIERNNVFALVAEDVMKKTRIQSEHFIKEDKEDFYPDEEFELSANLSALKKLPK